MKFPSIPYLTTSPCFWFENEVSSLDPEVFTSHPIVVTVKMDGSNVQLTRNHVAARNGKTADHPSFNALKSLHAVLRYRIPKLFTVFGEWLFVKHSIKYEGDLALPSYLMIFAIYDTARNSWYSWQDVENIAVWLEVPTVPVVAKLEITSPEKTRSFLQAKAEEVIAQGHEGIVVRRAEGFLGEHLHECTAKYVRENHVQTDEHWKLRPIEKNEKRGEHDGARKDRRCSQCQQW